MQSKDKLHIDFNNREAKGEFTVFEFMDHGYHIALIPTLNISAYGHKKEEAIKRLFEDVYQDLMKTFFNLGADIANAELKKLGWERNKYFKKRFKSGSFVDRDGILRDFNLPQETKIDTQVMTV